MLVQALPLAAENVSVDLTLHGIIALVVGLLILVRPRLLNYLVAGYLILIGLIEIFDVNISI